MAEPQVSLDLSKSQPLPQGQGQGVTLDLSKSQPITPPQANTPSMPAEPQRGTPATEDLLGTVSGFEQGTPNAPLDTSQSGGGFAYGGAKSATETFARPASWIAEKLHLMSPDKRAQLLSELEREGTGEKLGAGAEQVAEFIAGEAALKAGVSTLSGKYQSLAKAHKVLEDFPVIEKIVGAALTQGTVGGVQAAAHGASAEDALKTGVVTGGIGAAAEGVAGAAEKLLPAINKLRPSKVNIEGVDIPVRASQLTEVGNPSNVAGAAEKYLVDPDAINKFAGRTSEAAKGAIGEVADKVAEKTVRGLDEVAATAKQEAKGLFEETYQGAPPISNFADAANKIKEQARYAVFSKLDELSAEAKKAGEIEHTFEQVQEAIQDAKKAIRLGNNAGEARVALKAAQEEQAAILQKFGGYFHPDAIERGNAAWRQASALRKLNNVVELATKGTPEDLALVSHLNAALGGRAAQTAAHVPEMVNGKSLLNGLRKLDRSGELLDALGGDKSHRYALYQIANILASSPSKAEAARHIMLDVAGMVGASGGGALLGSGLAVGLGVGSGAAALHESARYFFTKLLTDPDALRILGKGVEAGAKIGTVVRRLAPVVNGWFVSTQVPDKQSEGTPISQASPTPDTHRFSLGKWQQANPDGDPEEAKAEATQQGYMVVA